MSPTRQLAVIMFTDIVGYTALMGKDSAKALELVRINRDIQKPLVEKHNGKWLKEMGDGVMVQFGSALDAVKCAIEIQEQARAQLDAKLRIGIHLGDITIENVDIYGDGVNVASRLESICDPGGIYITQSVQKAIKGYSINTEDLGNHRLKNVDEPTRVFAIQEAGLPKPKPSFSKDIGLNIRSLKFIALVILLLGTSGGIFLKLGNQKIDLPVAEIQDRSLAVMPFTNRSNNEEDLHFTEGIQDEIRSRLAKISGLRVLPRSSVQTFKTIHKNPRGIGNELGVGYLLEGGVQRALDFVRITVELIDVESERQIWSESYDVSPTPDNILNTQTEIAREIASYLGAAISDEEMHRIAKKSTANYQAYDYYLRAFKMSNMMIEATQESTETALRFYEQAIILDPDFALAHAMLADIHSWFVLRGWDRSKQRKMSAEKEAKKAIALAPDLSEGHYAMATYYYRVEKDYPKALESLRLAENGLRGEGFVHLLKGYIHRRAGQWNQALDALGQANILDPRSHVPHMQIGFTYLWLHRFEEAEDAFEIAVNLSHAERLTYNQFNLESIDLFKYGETGRLRQYLKSIDKDYEYYKWFIEFIDGHYEQALSVLDNSSDDFAINTQDNVIPKSLCRAWTFTSIKETFQAERAYQDAINDLTNLKSEIGEDFRILRSIGMAYAGLGKSELATSYGKEALELMSVERDAVWGMHNVEAMAIIYVQIGEFDKAIMEIRRLVNTPSYVPIITILKDPRYDPIRHHPQFSDIVTKLKSTNQALYH